MNTRVKHITVYKQGGVVTRECKISLKPGINNIELEGLSKSSSDHTLKMQLENLKYSNLQIKMLKKNELVGKLTVDITELERLKNEIEVKEYQKQLWAKNSDFTNKENLNYDEVAKFINNYSSNIMALNDEIVKLKLELTQKEAEYNSQFRTVDKKIITLDINSPDERVEVLQFSYFENNINWLPIFEVYANDGNDELQVQIKGKINQITSEVLENVSVTLFTGNPTSSQSIPTLSTEYVRFIQKSKEKPIKEKSMVSRVGNDSINCGASHKMLCKSSDLIADEALEDIVIKNDEETTTEYKLPGVWTISNNSNGSIVDLYTYTLPVELIHIIIPKCGLNGFLAAKVESNKLMDLDMHKTYIYYNNNYVGTSTIKVNREEDDTLLSLGIDEKLTGIRHIEKIHSNALTKQKDSIKVKLTISSDNKNKIKILVKDTLPKSTIDGVSITDINLNDGIYNEELGHITWDIELEPKSTKEIKFNYSITYPKNGFIY